jgi:hypothetical protein
VRLEQAAAEASAKMVSPAAKTVGIKKFDAELQVVWGEVFAPGLPDSQGDFMTETDITGMMHRFMKAERLSAIDTSHSQIDSGCHVVECFQARDSDPDFIPGSWVLGVWCPEAIWSGVKSGDFNGFSLDGVGVRVETVLELDIPDVLSGETLASEGHTHRFTVSFDEAGAYLGGATEPGGSDKHVHKIVKGCATEDTAGHSHRFSFVEGMMDVQLPEALLG